MKDHPSQWITSGLTCRDLADRATDFLEERLPILTKVRCALHLASCPSCRVYLQQIDIVSEWVRHLPPIAPFAINRLHLRQRFAVRRRGAVMSGTLSLDSPRRSP